MNKHSIFRLLPGAAALVLVLLSGYTSAAQTADSARINDLFVLAKEDAAQANYDAELIDTYIRSNNSWYSHARQIDEMKVHINSMGRVVADLKAARAEGSPWQQKAVDEIDPLLRSMADHLTAMIQHIDNNPQKVHLPAYADYTRANLQLSEKLLATIRDYIDYSEAKAKTEALEEKLQLPGASAS